MLSNGYLFSRRHSKRRECREQMGCAPSTANDPNAGGKASAFAGVSSSSTTATSAAAKTSSSPSPPPPLSSSGSFRRQRSLKKQNSPARTAIARLLSRKSRVVGGSGADESVVDGAGGSFFVKTEPGVGGGSFGLSEDLWDLLPEARAAAEAAAEAEAAAAAAAAAAERAPAGGGGSSRKTPPASAGGGGGSGGAAAAPRTFISLARDTLADALSPASPRPGTAAGDASRKSNGDRNGEDEEDPSSAASLPPASLTDEQLRERITTSGGARALALPSAGYAARYAFCSLRGFYPETLDKRNQDAVCAHERFGGDPEALLLAVFDGHGNHGAACSQFAMDALPAALLQDSLCRDAPEIALRDAATAANRALHASPIDDSLSGTTALVALLVKGRLLVANVGDSRAVLGVARPPPPNGSGGVAAVALSWDHTPFRRDEYERVLRAGARVLTLDQMEGIKDPSKPCWTSEDADSADPPRLWMPDALYPGTAFTRSLGDAAAERIGVIADPEVRPRALSRSDRFLVLASDGVWEFMSNQEVVDLVASEEESKGDPQRACVLLCVEAYRRWLLNETRTDDITAAVLWFEGEPGSNKNNGAGTGGDGSSNADGGGGSSAVAAAIQRASMACAAAAGAGGDLGSAASGG